MSTTQWAWPYQKLTKYLDNAKIHFHSAKNLPLTCSLFRKEMEKVTLFENIFHITCHSTYLFICLFFGVSFCLYVFLFSFFSQFCTVLIFFPIRMLYTPCRVFSEFRRYGIPYVFFKFPYIPYVIRNCPKFRGIMRNSVLRNFSNTVKFRGIPRILV